MLGYPASNVADIATDPQLEARDFWQDLPDRSGRIERHCGPFYIADERRPQIRYYAVDDSAAVLGDFGFSETEIESLLENQSVEAA
jgi:crotonobetainyl-CoA:carnitine CoA-transferase CaiB-like acyl-CoA transferase